MIFGEIVSVAARKEVTISPGLMDEYIDVTQNLRGYHTSMYEDYIDGRLTEIDYFNGYVCREGEKLNVPTPVNAVITSLVKSISYRRISEMEHS